MKEISPVSAVAVASTIAAAASAVAGMLLWVWLRGMLERTPYGGGGAVILISKGA